MKHWYNSLVEQPKTGSNIVVFNPVTGGVKMDVFMDLFYQYPARFILLFLTTRRQPNLTLFSAESAHSGPDRAQMLKSRHHAYAGNKPEERMKG